MPNSNQSRKEPIKRKKAGASKKKTSLVLNQSLSQPKIKIISAAPELRAALSPLVFLMLVAGVSLLGLNILHITVFQWLGTPLSLSDSNWNLFLVGGIILTAIGFYKLPSLDSKRDLPRWFAYPALILIFAAGIYLRFYRAGQPQGFYWDDEAIGVLDTLGIVDRHYFPIIFTYGGVEPLDRYVQALIWWLFPSWKAVFVERVAADFFSLTAMWLAYRVGREISGKRLVGLLLTAFLAASKPMLLLTICATNNVTVNFFSSTLYLLFQVRLFKKPDLVHFLEWGLVLALGLYTYTVIRPWFFFLILITLGWILWKGRKEAARGIMLAPLLFIAGFVPFFLDKMLGVFHENFISNIWAGKLWLFWQMAFLTAFIYGYRVSKENRRVLYSWGLGILLAEVLSYPLVLGDTSSKITCVSLFPAHFSELFTSQFFNSITNQIGSTLRSIFISDDDRADMNFFGDPLFDYHGAVFLILGVIWAIVRPSWFKTLLLFFAGISLIPRILTVDPESSKTMGTIIPLLLLGAMGIAHWMESSWGSKQTRWMGLLLVVGLSAFWSWEIKGTYTRVFDKWWSLPTYDTRLNEQVNLDMPDKRIYMVSTPGFRFYSEATMGILQDRNPLYKYRDSNEMVVFPDEPRKDLVVLVSPYSTKVVDRLKKEFPKAQWSTLWYELRSPEPYKLSYRVLIPADQIPDKPGKAFWYHEVSRQTWVRRVYPGYALARAGMILFEDASLTLNPMDLTVQNEGGEYSIWAEDEWIAPKDGAYHFSINTHDSMEVVVDGKILVDSKPFGTMAQKKECSVDLKKGPHMVNLLSLNKVTFADVTIRNDDLKMNQVLGN